MAEGVVRIGRVGGSVREGGGRALPPYSLRLVAACAGEPRGAAAAAGRLHGGREGRGDGARHSRVSQGQGREGALPRQQGQHQLLPHRGPPPPRRLRCHPYLRVTREADRDPRARPPVTAAPASVTSAPPAP
eukprot:scaffold61848_cov50-Phaeocystis_antarctica.AAC.1